MNRKKLLGVSPMTFQDYICKALSANRVRVDSKFSLHVRKYLTLEMLEEYNKDNDMGALLSKCHLNDNRDDYNNFKGQMNSLLQQLEVVSDNKYRYHHKKVIKNKKKQAVDSVALQIIAEMSCRDIPEWVYGDEGLKRCIKIVVNDVWPKKNVQVNWENANATVLYKYKCTGCMSDLCHDLGLGSTTTRRSLVKVLVGIFYVSCGHYNFLRDEDWKIANPGYWEQERWSKL